MGVSSKMSAQRILLKKILTCTVAELDWLHCDDGCLVWGPFRVDLFYVPVLLVVSVSSFFVSLHLSLGVSLFPVPAGILVPYHALW